MSTYLKEENIYWPAADNAVDFRKKLDAGTYLVGHHERRGFYLTLVDNFDVTGKIYGNTESRAERILNTASDRPGSTGVLLTGEKGSGKTLLSKVISKKGVSRGMVVLIVNKEFAGDEFSQFITSINEPSVVLFDEFEKVYSPKSQEEILTLLDGVFLTKKLFIFTVNNEYRVNENMKNRPGRIFYHLTYAGLDKGFIREYCKDNLLNKDYIENVVRLTHVFEIINFDMLKALVEDMNRYNETPAQVLELLNARPLETGGVAHNIQVVCNNVKLDPTAISPRRWAGNPLSSDSIDLWIEVPVTPAEGESNDDVETDSEYISITSNDLINMDVEKGKFVYSVRNEQDRVCEIIFERDPRSEPKTPHNWLKSV